MEIRTMKLSELCPMPGNPRRIRRRALSALHKSVARFGLVQPIVWNRRTGHVVGGHQRLRVLQEQGVRETEVVVVDLPEAEEKALNLTLNNPAAAGEWTGEVNDMVQELWQDLPEWVDELELGALNQVDLDGFEQSDIEARPFERKDKEQRVWIQINTDQATAAAIESMMKREFEDDEYSLERSDVRPG